MYYICVLPVAFPDFGFVQRERVVLAISFSLSPRESYTIEVPYFPFTALMIGKKSILFVFMPHARSNRCLKEWTKRAPNSSFYQIKEGILFPSLPSGVRYALDLDIWYLSPIEPCGLSKALFPLQLD